LLLCCARTATDTHCSARIRDLLRGAIDWGYLVELADHHRVLPLLYENLRTLCPDAVPGATLDRLRDSFHASAGHNLCLAGELLRILALLAEHGIVAIPFKGPVLAVAAYGGLGLRQSGDLDILVHERDIPKAEDLLRGRGYRPVESPTPEVWGPGASRLRALMDYNHVLVPREGGPIVELHWAFAEPYYGFHPDPGRLCERLRRIPLVGTPVPVLSAEDSLLILCVHGARHRWERLTWICDIAELNRAHPEMDWGRVLEEARGLRAERILFLGLRLARDLLSADLPSEVWRRVEADGVAESLARQVCERLCREPDRPPRNLERQFTQDGISWESARFQLCVREKLRDRLRYLSYLAQLALTPTPRDRALLPLPTPLAFLAYLLRPIRLIVGYCSRVMGR
jgi:hypothetical protein